MAKTKANRVVGIMAGVERDWQAENDLDTLMRAQAIERDKKRLAAAQALAKKRLLDTAAVIKEGGADDKE